MARIFVTGSAEGLGLLAGQRLIERGHDVFLHGRNAQRSRDALAGAPGASGVVTGDLSTIAGAQGVAEQANAIGRFDAVIHNAGVGSNESRRTETEPRFPHIFMVNVLATYTLTALMLRPARLIYVSSGVHHRPPANIDDLLWTKRPWNGGAAYAESKLHDVMLAFAVARLWPDVLSNALEPGWVATRMGGPHAPDDLDEGSWTQAWLAVSDDPLACGTGQYFRHRRLRDPNPAARDEKLQDILLARCAELSGVRLA